MSECIDEREGKYDITIFQDRESVFNPECSGVTMYGIPESQCLKLIPVYMDCEMAIVLSPNGIVMPKR